MPKNDYAALLHAVAGIGNAQQIANVKSLAGTLDVYASKFGLDVPHRLAHFLAQVLHESGAFRYDREVWGPTPAQARYDTRADLGNTPEADGDGKLYMGRAAIQITGKANYRDFRGWCRQMIAPGAPDFVASPELVNTNPWEGLAPIWYWSTRNLNRLADQNDIEMITRRINGGLNGYPDRLGWYDRAALILLGYEPAHLSGFQRDHGLQVDGVSGQRTRAAMHKALVALKFPAGAPGDVKAAPVEHRTTETVIVAPPQIDKSVEKTTGFWERLAQIGATIGGLGSAAWLQDWRVVLAVGGVLVGVSIVGLVLHKRIIDAVKTAKQELAR